MRRITKISAVLSAGLFSLAATACTSDGGDTASEGENSDFKACMVSDSGGFDDKSFNETSLAGQDAAEEDLGIETATVESAGDSEYANNIAQLVEQGCDHITTVGFLLGDATLASAQENTDLSYAIVDFAYADDQGNNTAPDNLKGLTYATDQPAFLAGYLAAGMTESDKVGTLGGQNIPTVTIFMEGFRRGVDQYNQDNGTKVQVLGWNGKSGSFTDDFEDKTKAQAIGEQLIGQGADIIMPVAGPSGLGALQAAKDAGVKGIWVDSDGYESTEFGDILLTSVVKGMDVSVEQAITDSVNDEYDNEIYLGTLENEGVGLADYHDFEDQVPDELKDKIDELRQQIIDGELTTS
ncbi:BMP family lipoprotein [Nocardioides insulae]|uniref:BMP family lipoprotein n=1 Tax=Nocardioides insulae TaxID=394734 RepID=UPI0003FA6425|nr:BMP family ABC transporter substrate-binding protein [Nocardioides insulae]